jgi:hypothetical protein
MRVSKLRHIAICIFAILTVTNQINASDLNLSVKNHSNNIVNLRWHQDELILDTQMSGDQIYTHISFPSGSYPESPHKPAIPFKEFLLAVPDGAEISWNLSSVVQKEVMDVLPIPVVYPVRDKNNISTYETIIDKEDYNFLPQSQIEISEQLYFRNLPVVRVRFYPVTYDHNQKKIRFISQANISFVFKNGAQFGESVSSNAKIDNLYSEVVINFEQGKSWMKQKPRQLRKPGLDFQNPWYRITVEEDGLYKISRSVLASAGINVSSIDPRSIKLYNNGGRPLNIKSLAEDNNPDGPVENAILVIGEEDGVFNESDYVLFYGKKLAGWFANETNGDFTYVEHPYDTRNYYWLTFDGTPGRRMNQESVSQAAAATTESHFIQRERFEEDQYNLLASGNDWYGHRFYGISANVSFTYPLDYSGSNLAPGRMKIKFKSGNLLRYADSGSYYYYFTVILNQQPVLVNQYLGSKGSREYESSFTADNNFLNGNNTLAVEYSANAQDCNAYLDWVEFYYPMEFTAVNNSLMFFTNQLGAVTKYQISNFTSSDILLFDISEPINTTQLTGFNPAQNGVLSFNLDLTTNKHKRLIATTLNSPQIKNVEQLTPYMPDKNLLDASLAADMLIITHPSFKSYAQEIAQLRANGTDPVSSVIVNTRDIYFFFSSGVQDVTAIRNFIRHAYNNWSNPGISYVMLFGDGHYDYRKIALPDTNWVPPFEISNDYELYSRETDNYYVDIDFNYSGFASILPDIAIGRLPAESHIDARRIVNKLKTYETARERDGWQTVLTFVADDEVTSRSSTEWMHQRDTDTLTRLSEIQRFLIKKIYLSAYNSVPGGFGRVKPEANKAIIDQLNEGTLLINYVGHGSPEEWAHEDVLNMTRDLNRIQNQGRLPIWLAATCDFGKYDDPREPSFSEALIWQEDAGAIAVFSSARLVFSTSNFALNSRLIKAMFPAGRASRRLGEAVLLATGPVDNDQKYHLFGDPSMYLADPREYVEITNISPDTLKALSKVKVDGFVSAEPGGDLSQSFNGGAFMIANDARYDSVNTGGDLYYQVLGPRIFKGEISVNDGRFSGEFIVPKSIRYYNKPTGRVTIFAWDPESGTEALGNVSNLLLNGTEENLSDADGPEIDIYFKDQENFNPGDLVPASVTLIAEIEDENGINLTEEVGHSIEIKINDEQPQNITSFFAYDRDSYSNGKLNYYLDNLPAGEHFLTLKAWDNINNPSEQTINFRVSDATGLVLSDVVNYPNPTAGETHFTFQAQPASDAALVEVEIKIYTISGRLIKKIDGLYLQQPGYNYYHWDGRDEDGSEIANGVYLYKVTIKEGDTSKEVLEKLVVLK